MPEKSEFVKKYHPMLQTPGRVQHYRVEVLPYLSDEQKMNIRMATETTTSRPKATYRNKVEEEVLRFVQEKIGSNYFDHKKGLNLNVTIHEAELMMESVPALKEASDSGELHDIHKACEEQENLMNQQMNEVTEHLEAVVAQIEAKENETYEALSKFGFEGFVAHGDSSVFDLFGGSRADNAANNYQICMNQNHGFDAHV